VHPSLSAASTRHLLGHTQHMPRGDALDERVDRPNRSLSERHSPVSELAWMLGQTTDLAALYETIYRHIGRLMTVNAFIVSSYDRARREIRARFLIADGVAHDVSGFSTIPLEEEGFGIQSEVIRTGRALHLPDFVRAMAQTRSVVSFSETEGTPDGGTREKAQERISTRSAILVPMQLRGETVGVMQVQSKKLGDYTDEDVELLASLANASAVALQNAELLRDLVRANEQLRATLDGALKAIAMTTEI